MIPAARYDKLASSLANAKACFRMNPPPHKASLRIANSIAEMRKVAEFVDRFGVQQALPAAVINALNLCLDEILNNAISYGYDDKAPHQISISLVVADRVVIAEVEDDAKPFDPRVVPPRPLAGPLRTRQTGGLGLHFVNSLMDEVDYARVDGYNRLKLMKRLHGRVEQAGQ
jgi:anti-sigma regulatory factor (Ser/Thr protein kinase)